MKSGIAKAVASMPRGPSDFYEELSPDYYWRPRDPRRPALKLLG
jgi:hypothetical protein